MLKYLNKKIAVIGASYLQLPLVERAMSLDIETHCFAFEEGAICRNFCTKFYPVSILEKEEILDYCKTIGINGVLTIASDLAVPTVNFIAETLRLSGNSTSSSLICTNKYLMKETLAKEGFNVAKFYSVSSINDLRKLDSLCYPLIVKPVDRSGSIGVNKVDSDMELETAFKTALNYSIKKEVVIEEFIEGYEISVEAISMNKSHFVLAFTDKVTSGSPYFVELEHHQPSRIDGRLKMEILKLIPRALSSLKIYTGASHSEFIITKDAKIYINEIGARMGGDFIGSHLVELSTGYNYLDGVIDSALGINNKPVITENMHSGVIFTTSENNDRMSEISPDDPFVVEYKPTTKIKKKFTKSGDRNGYFIYQSDKKIEFDKI